MKIHRMIILGMAPLLFCLGCGEKGGYSEASSVTAERPRLTVSVSGSHLTFSTGASASVQEGGTVAITVTPDNGYTYRSTVSGTCPAGSWNGSTYSTGAITTHCSVEFTPVAFLRIYMTSTTQNGNLGGVSGADNLCANDANHPGSGTFKAMISDGVDRVACTVSNCGAGSTSTDWVLRPNVEYRRMDGTTVIGITTSGALFSGTLTNAPDASNVPAILGMGSNGVASGNNCSRFTDGSATVGNQTNGTWDPSSTNSALAFGGRGMECSDLTRLYCVEQP